MSPTSTAISECIYGLNVAYLNAMRRCAQEDPAQTAARFGVSPAFARTAAHWDYADIESMANDYRTVIFQPGEHISVPA